MPTWAETLAQQDRALILWATIEGVGDSDGLWRFSSGEGWALGAGEGSWRPWLAELPDVLSQRVPYIEGGVVEDEGGLSLELVDIGEALTEALQLDQGPTTFVATGGASAAATTIVVTSTITGLTVGDILWVGAEAVEVTSIAGTNLGVTRGVLSTTATAHDAGTRVWVRVPYLRTRTVRLYVGPLDGSESDARQLGGYQFDGLSWDDELTTWQLEARTAQSYLDAQVPSVPLRGPASSWERDGVVYVGSAGLESWPGNDDARYALPDGEVINEAADNRVTYPYSAEAPDDPPEVGIYSLVLTGLGGDFRYQEGDGSRTSDRSSAAWIPTDHWIDILLCILLSPADPLGAADNYDSSATGFAGRNYSGLPGGYGCGVPHTQVDWASFEVARAQSNLRLPYFLLGPSPKPLREIANELLRPLGVGAIMNAERDGTIRVVVPVPVTAEETPSVTIDADSVLAGSDGFPAMTVSRPTDSLLTAVEYVIGPIEWPVRSVSDFDADGETLTIEVPGGDPADEGLFSGFASRRLFRAFRPSVVIEADIEFAEAWDWRIGEIASIDLAAVPNLQGARGLVGTAQLVEHEPRFDVERGAWVRCRMFVEPAVRVGRISPAADVTSVTGSTATVVANRYTDTDAPTGFPTSDAGSFTVGDVVQIMGADGAPLNSGSTETVDSISGNDLTLSGDFGGLLASGTTIYTADQDEQVVRQSQRYAAMSADLIWFYG